jgi:hypothetical protein
LLRPAALAKTISEVGGQLFSTLFLEKNKLGQPTRTRKKKKKLLSPKPNGEFL